MEEMFYILSEILRKDCSIDSSWQCVSIGSGNGFGPVQHQTISLTNNNLVHWCIYVSASLKGLNQSQSEEG